MSINKNRKFRFAFGNFVESPLDPESQNNTTTIQMSEANITDSRSNTSQDVNMSESERNRLHAMAMQAKANGGNSTANSSYADYLAKIPAKQDNMITMSIAGDKVKELKTKMIEEIEKTSGDSMTADILSTTADDNIVYKDYNMTDLDKYIEKIPSMTMLEAISLKNSVTKELNRLESCHTMVKAVSELRDNFDTVTPGKEPTMLDRKNAGTNVDKKILTANYLDEYGYEESAEEFKTLYDAYHPKLTSLVEAIDKHIEECSKQAASTKYMTNDFLHIIEKKINNMKPTDMNYDYTMKKLQVLKTAFENRTDLTYLSNKLSLFIKNKTHMKNLAKAMNGTFTNIGGKLRSNFTDASMNSFLNGMEAVFGQDRDAVIILVYFLDYVCATEAKSNADSWVKVFILNITDIRRGIWDMDIHFDQYLARVDSALYPQIEEIEKYLATRKSKISNSIYSTYNTLISDIDPKPKKKEETPEETAPVEDDIEHVDAEVVGVDTSGNGIIIDSDVE